MGSKRPKMRVEEMSLQLLTNYLVDNLEWGGKIKKPSVVVK